MNGQKIMHVYQNFSKWTRKYTYIYISLYIYTHTHQSTSSRKAKKILLVNIKIGVTIDNMEFRILHIVTSKTVEWSRESVIMNYNLSLGLEVDTPS